MGTFLALSVIWYELIVRFLIAHMYNWRASEACETLSGLFNRESGIYYGTCNFSLQRRRAIRRPLYCSSKNPATLGYVSVLEFVSIESYLKAISSDYGSNKEY